MTRTRLVALELLATGVVRAHKQPCRAELIFWGLKGLYVAVRTLRHGSAERALSYVAADYLEWLARLQMVPLSFAEYDPVAASDTGYSHRPQCEITVDDGSADGQEDISNALQSQRGRVVS